MMEIIDPTDERVPLRRNLAPRPHELAGSLALLDISKPRGDLLLARLADRLAERLPELKIRRYSKPTFTKPAPEELRRRIAEENALVVEALAD